MNGTEQSYSCHYWVQKHEPRSKAGKHIAPEKNYNILALSQCNDICLLKLHISHGVEGEGTLRLFLILQRRTFFHSTVGKKKGF